MMTLDPFHPSSDFLARLDAVEARLGRIAGLGRLDGLTEPDQGGEERWEAAQVWAHTAEFIPYWTRQIELLIGAASPRPEPFGRTRTDPERNRAVAAGRGAEIDDLASRVGGAISNLRVFLGELTPEDLSVRGVHEMRGVMTVSEIVEAFCVGHLEEHAAQLERLAGIAPAPPGS